MTSVTVRPRDLRAAGMCARAARPWFAAQGLSWNQFVTEGYPVETIRGTNDALALKVADVAEERARREAVPNG